MNFADALHLLPKVELHCHIEGTMRPSTVIDLAHANGITLPASNTDDLYTYDNLTGFLEIFWLVQSVLCTSNDWERLAYESIIDGATHQLVCPNANVRINPDVCPSLPLHVFGRMREAGLVATLNTDDPSLTALDLTEEYVSVAGAFGYDWHAMVEVALDGVEGSWLDEADQLAVRNTVIHRADELHRDLGTANN